MVYVYSIHIKRIHAGQKLKYIPNAWITLGSVRDQDRELYNDPGTHPVPEWTSKAIHYSTGGELWKVRSGQC